MRHEDAQMKYIDSEGGEGIDMNDPNTMAFNMEDLEGMQEMFDSGNYFDDDDEEEMEAMNMTPRDVEMEEIIRIRNINYFLSLNAFIKERARDGWVGNYPEINVPETFKFKLQFYTIKKKHQDRPHK